MSRNARVYVEQVIYREMIRYELFFEKKDKITVDKHN